MLQLVDRFVAGRTTADAVDASANSGDVTTGTTPSPLASTAFNEFQTNAGNDVIHGNGATRVTLDYLVERQGGISSKIVFTSATSGSGTADAACAAVVQGQHPHAHPELGR